MFSDFLRLIKGFLLVIGPKSAGKSSIIYRLVTGNFEEKQPTLGFAEEYITKVRVIEIGGQSNFQDYWSVLVKQKPAHIFYVIDITKKDEFFAFESFLKENLKFLDKNSIETTLCINKYDLTNSLPDYINLRPQDIVCSAKIGKGMMDILEKIAEYREQAGIDYSNDIIQSKDTKEKENISEEKIRSIKQDFEGKILVRE